MVLPVWGQSQDNNAGKVFYEGDRVRIQQSVRIITIEGNAFIRKATQGLKADKIIWYQDEEYAEAFDNVTFLDREQGVLYKGNYVKFFIEKNLVYVRENPSIENRKDSVTIYANAFDANTKDGSIVAKGNTRMIINKDPKKPINAQSQDADYSTIENRFILKKNAVLKTKEQWFHGDVIDIDQNKNFLTLTGNVRIEDSPEQKKKAKNNQDSGERPSNSLGNSVLTCDRSTLFTDNNFLECFGNVALEDKVDQTLLKSQYLLLDNPKEEIVATDKVSFYQKNPTNERYLYSQYMKVYQKSETIYFTNEVSFIDIQKGETNIKLDCYSMKYLYGEEREDLIECFKDVVIANPEEDSDVYSDYLFYQVESGVGYVDQKPYSIKRQEKNDLFFYSERMDIDRGKNVVQLQKDVLIIEKDKTGKKTNSTITCSRGEMLYSTGNNNDTFTCTGKVDVFMTQNQTHFYGDTLVYFLQKEYSRLDADNGKVLFDYKKSPTNLIKGTGGYVENFHGQGYSIMSNGVYSTEFQNNRPINHTRSQWVRYHFLSQSNALEGFQDVVHEDIDNNSVLYSDYLFYDLSLDQGWVSGLPVLVSSDEQKNEVNLVYADIIRLDNKNKRSHLVKNVNIFKDNRVFKVPPRTPQIPLDQNFLKCEEAYYYFVDEERIFECVKEAQLIDRENQIDVFADYMRYHIKTDYGFLKSDPYLVSKRNISNTQYIYSDTMEFFRPEGISLFHTNVFTREMNATTGVTNSTVNCDEGKYHFKGATNTVECFENVKVINLIDEYEITGKYLRHQVIDDYSYVSDKAKVVWKGDERPTVVEADLFENFGEEKLLYAKGNVKVDNGENQAESSLGIYEPKLNKFTLYGTPLVRDREGSEFTSEEVYFDVVKNSMTLGSDVGGNFIPEGFLDQ